MSNDNKTLADVQPGGRVRLGDEDEKAPQELPALIVTRGNGIALPDQAAGIEEFKRQCLRRIEAEYPHLSAQPSPGGQDGLNYERMFVDACAALAEVSRELGCDPEQGGAEPILAAIAELREALAARQPVGDQHPDDLAVDAFAAAMKAKMAAARAKGRGGWEDPAQCSADDLSSMLRDHVEKGDPCDVANFCMMLHQRGEAIASCQPVGEPITVEAVATVRRNGDGDRYIDWLTEGGIADLEVGDVLMVSDRAITDEDGSGEVYAAPPAQAWVVTDGQGARWRMWGSFGPAWTTDRDQALHFARRADAEAFANDDEDAWLIQAVPNG